MNKKLLELIRNKFEALSAGKTEWGWHDILEAYWQCVNEAVLEILDETESKET